MDLTIIGPTTSYAYQAAWFEVTTVNGSFIVQDGHVPTIASLKENAVFVIGTHDGQTKHIPIKGGLVKIDRDKATVLITHE